MTQLSGMIGRTLRMIAWENFVDPAVWAAWLAALAAVLGAVWVFWSLGDLLHPRRHAESAVESIALRGLGGAGAAAILLFLLASVGAYRAVVVAFLAVAVVGLAAVRRRHPLAFPRELWSALRAEPVLWAFAALCSIETLLPALAWDEVMIHYAYADQWVRAGRLTLDPYAWYPLYTYNWQLLQGTALMFGSETLGHMYSWLAGVLASLCVLAFVRGLGTGPAIARVAAFAFLATPLVQAWLTSGYVDVPMMAMLTAATFGLWRLTRLPDPGPRDAILPALCAGVFLGMKVTALFYGPIFFVLGAVLLRGRARATYLVAFCAFASPWYLRNLLLSGDPAPPLFSLVLHRPAPLWSAEDIRWVREQIVLSYRPLDLALIPVRALRGMPDTPFPDWPVLGYVLLFPLTPLLALRWRHGGAIVPLAVAWWGALVWVGTSYLLRYCVFLPLMVVCAALLVSRLLDRAPWPALRRRGWVVAAVVLVGPTWSAVRYPRYYVDNRIPTTAEAKWRHVVAGVPEARTLDDLSVVAKPPANVYLTQIGLRYLYQRRGYRVVGNMLHPGRFSDLQRALHAGAGADFLRGVGADWVVVDRRWTQHYFGEPADSVTASLARQPGLTLVREDSAAAILRVERGSGASATAARPPADTVAGAR